MEPKFPLKGLILLSRLSHGPLDKSQPRVKAWGLSRGLCTKSSTIKKKLEKRKRATLRTKATTALFFVSSNFSSSAASSSKSSQSSSTENGRDPKVRPGKVMVSQVKNRYNNYSGAMVLINSFLCIWISSSFSVMQ